MIFNFFITEKGGLLTRKNGEKEVFKPFLKEFAKGNGDYCKLISDDL